MQKINTKTIKYSYLGEVFEGYCAYPKVDKKMPAVLIAHTWAGRDTFVCETADKLAKLGYVGFAIDLYGRAKVGKSIEENQALMTPLMSDRSLLKNRLKESLKTLAVLENVDSMKISAIGFCFGGLCVLDMARNNMQLKGIVSFHGLLSKPNIETKDKIWPRVLVLHGNDDPMVSEDDIKKFKEEMTERDADWAMHIFGKTKHAFTNPKANDEKLGTVYNENSANKAWKLTYDFLKESY